MSRLTCALSGVTYVLDSDTVGRASAPQRRTARGRGGRAALCWPTSVARACPVRTSRSSRSYAGDWRIRCRVSGPLWSSGRRRGPGRGVYVADQSSGRAANAFLVFMYHRIPDTGFFHLPCMLFRALLCASSPPATISFRWLSSAFMTSSAVCPRNGASHAPPICRHVIVFMFAASFSCRVVGPGLVTRRRAASAARPGEPSRRSRPSRRHR